MLVIVAPNITKLNSLETKMTRNVDYIVTANKCTPQAHKTAFGVWTCKLMDILIQTFDDQQKHECDLFLAFSYHKVSTRL